MPKRSILKPHDPDEMATSSNHNDKKTVRWGEMVVFEFPNMLGDNPAVSGGVPLTIAWNHVNVSTVTVEYNEFLRVKQPRRKRKDLVLSSAQRDTVSNFFIAPLSLSINDKCFLFAERFPFNILLHNSIYSA